MRVRVKTARGRTSSSTRWLDRQLNDPYVHEARKQGLRSRAAFKIAQLDDQYKLFRRGQKVVDIGAAPGGWTQIAVERVAPDESGGVVIAVDIQEMEPVGGATTMVLDINDPTAPALLSPMRRARKAPKPISSRRDSGGPNRPARPPCNFSLCTAPFLLGFEGAMCIFRRHSNNRWWHGNPRSADV